MYQTIRLKTKILFVFLCLASASFAQNRPQPKQVPARPSAPFLQYVKSYEETTYVTKIVMKNGMTVLVDEFRTQPLVTIQVYVRAGSLDEPIQNPGLATLVSRIIQRGIPDKSGGSYRQKIQALGGIARSSVDYATSVFETIAPSGQWKKALAVQAEAIQNPSFDGDSIRLEAKMLQGEARSSLEDPMQVGREKLLEVAFSLPRMGRAGAMQHAAMETYSPENLGTFYKAFYASSRMMLVVSGDIGSGEVLNEIVKLYTKPATPAGKQAAAAVNASQNEFRFSSIRGNVAVPHLLFGFHTVPENDEDAKAIQVLRAVLGLGEASLLSARVRDEKRLIFSSQSELLTSFEFGYLFIGAAISASSIDPSELAILTELELLKREELTELDLERAFGLLEREYWSGMETVTGRAGTLAHFEFLGDWKRMDRSMAELRKIKPSDVKRVAAKYLRLQNCTLLELLPTAFEERSLTAAAVASTFSSLLNAATEEEMAKRDKQTVLAVTIPPPGSFKFSEIRYPFQTASILRGPALYIREDHSNPLIEMGLFFPGGRLDEKRENAGITRLMSALLLPTGEEARQFYRQLEVYGGHLIPVVTDDYFGVYLSVLSQNFEAAFKQILAAMREPNFDEAVVKRQKEIQVFEIQSGISREYPAEWMRRALFGDFPYGAGSNGTQASVSAVTVDSLKAWYDSHVRNRKPIVTLIGDTKGTSLATVFVQNFSGSRFQDSKIPEGYAKALEKGQTATRDWDGNESLILIGFQAPPMDDEDAAAATVLEAYSGDYGRLTQELRDRLGLGYRVAVRYRPRARGGSFTICAATIPGMEDDLLKALRKEIQGSQEEAIPYRDFRTAISEAVGEYSIQQQNRFNQIAGIAENTLAGRGLEGYQGQIAGFQDVREEDLKAVIQRVFNLNKANILVLRGRN